MRLIVKIEGAQVRWIFVLLWILANSIGFAITLALFGAIGTILAGAIGWGIAGIIVGTTQWFVLQQQVSWIRWRNWVIASVIGFGFGFILGILGLLVIDIGGQVVIVFGGQGGMLVYAAVLGAGAGCGLGLMQWRILRQHVSQAGWWWVLASTLGWCGAWIVRWAGTLQGLFDTSNVIITGGVVGAVSGSIAGSITGFVLVWLLQYSTATVERKSSYPTS